ncbi:MAG: AAA family ATPase [Pseudonocardia sp.]|nr:AAA family ATPase [Pseudonocardia sp.]
MPYRRPLFDTVLARLTEPRARIQVLAGPRQTGKTTLVRQALDEVDLPSHYASADQPSLRDRGWLQAQWDIGRLRARDSGRGAVLVLDEAQKITAWSDVVKRLWDEDSAAGIPLRVALLGSAPMLVQRGLADSLAGRFEMVRVPHWSYPEMRDAFGFDLDTYLYFGGYPGSADLVGDRARWASYVQDSLIETTLSRDVLLLTRVDKPALLRQVFRLGCEYSGQIVAYQKMVGQLQDAGNTTTVAHYLELLGGSGLVTGLQKYSGSRVRQRGSSPKLVALNTALISAGSDLAPRVTRERPDLWGRLVESAVGAHLVNTTTGPGATVTYWRDRHDEVDFVIGSASTLLAVEVKSGRHTGNFSGLDRFRREHPQARTLVVGSGGIELEEFLSSPAETWLHGTL